MASADIKGCGVGFVGGVPAPEAGMSDPRKLSPVGGTATQPRWLSDEEQQTWRGFIAVNQLLFEALDRQLQQDANMPQGYYILLAMLSEAPNRQLRMSELAEITQSSQSRVSHAVSRLEEAGWVRREKVQGDRRGNLAVLTDEGWEVLVRTAPGHVAAVRENLFDLLTPEQVRQLFEICAVVLDKLDPEGQLRVTRAARGERRE
jgi:DNA-binding MarR family transcriptional regulator